jgi:hypothetical protein
MIRYVVLSAIVHSLGMDPKNEWIDLVHQVDRFDEFKVWLNSLSLPSMEQLKVHILLTTRESANTQQLTLLWNQFLVLMEKEIGFSLHFMVDSEPDYWWPILQDMMDPLSSLSLDYLILSGYLAVQISLSCQSHSSQLVIDWMTRAEFIFRWTAQLMNQCQYSRHRTMVAKHWIHVQCSMIELGLSKTPMGQLMEQAQSLGDSFAQSLHLRCKTIQFIPLIQKNDWETVQKQLGVLNEGKKSMDMNYILDILNSLVAVNVFESLNRLQVSIWNGELVKGMQALLGMTQQGFDELGTKAQMSILVSVLGILLQLKIDQVPDFYQKQLHIVARWIGISLSVDHILERMNGLDRPMTLKYRAFASPTSSLLAYVKTMLEYPNDMDHYLRTAILTMDQETQFISKHFGLSSSQLQTQLTSNTHWVALPIKKPKHQQALQDIDQQLRLLCIRKRQLEQSLKQVDVSMTSDEPLPVYHF